MKPIQVPNSTRPRRLQAIRMVAAPFDRAEIERINRADELAYRAGAVLVVAAALLAVFSLGLVDASLLRGLR